MTEENNTNTKRPINPELALHRVGEVAMGFKVSEVYDGSCNPKAAFDKDVEAVLEAKLPRRA